MKFKKRIIRPGTYSMPTLEGKQRVHVGKKRIKQWVENFNRMTSLGLQVPAPWHHDPAAEPLRLSADKKDIDAFNNAGFWTKLWQEPNGELWGEIDVPRSEDASKVGSTVQDVSLVTKSNWHDGQDNQFEDAITHIALVTHPVAKDDLNFIPQENNLEIALSLNELIFADDMSGMDGEATDGMDASQATVKDVIKMLAEVAEIVLPPDTNADNILERLVVALSAIKGSEPEEQEEGGVREPPNNSKEQPGPVAMSKELDLALSLLGQANVTNPATKRPYTEAEIKALAKQEDSPIVNLKLSQEDQATINFAKNQLTQSYKSRLEALVKKGKAAPATVKQLAERLNNMELRFAFDDQGEPIKTDFDFVLETLESLPDGTALTGKSPTSAKAEKSTIFGQQAFSLGSSVTEEENPDDFNAELSDEQVDAVLKLQGII